MRRKRYVGYGKYGPKKPDHPSVGAPCFACKKPFQEGDFTTLVFIGPGDDKKAREKCREGKAYIAVALEIHYACVTGRED